MKTYLCNIKFKRKHSERCLMCLLTKSLLKKEKKRKKLNKKLFPRNFTHIMFTDSNTPVHVRPRYYYLPI